MQPLRLSWFIDWLEACCLWPTRRQEDMSWRTLIETVSTCVQPPLLQASWAHSCDAEKNCPYEAARHTVIEAVSNAIQKVKGLELGDYRIVAINQTITIKE